MRRANPFIMSPACDITQRWFIAALWLACTTLFASTLAAQSQATWRLRPLTRIEGVETAGGYTFNRVNSILVARNGSVVVADVGNVEIRVFSADGKFLNRIGAEGRGPGEYERIGSLGLLGDTVWVIDSRLRRTTLFRISGEFQQVIQSDRSRPGTALPNALVAKGRVLGVGNSTDHGREPHFPLLLMNRSGRVLDTLAWLPNLHPAVVTLARSGGGYTIGPQPFSDAGLSFVSPEGTRIFVVDRSAATAAENASFRITAFEPDGETVWDRTFRYTPTRFERSRADSLLKATERLLGGNGNAETDIRRAVFIPQYYVPITDGFVSGDGSLWLRREEHGASVEYRVIAANGRGLATLTVPATTTLLAGTSSEIWGVERDEYDVPTVVRYAILK